MTTFQAVRFKYADLLHLDLCLHVKFCALKTEAYIHTKVLNVPLLFLYILVKIKSFENSKENQPVEQNKRNKHELSDLLETDYSVAG